MSIFVSTNTGTQTESAQQIEFRRQLDAIPSWSARAQKIEDRLQETTRALAVCDEQLYALRGDFDALTMDFWNAFARRLGCENPSETIARQQAWQRSVGYIGTILFFVVVTLLLFVHLQTFGSTGSAVFIGVLGSKVISRNTGLTGPGATEILQELLTTNFRYRRLVEAFHTLSALDGEHLFWRL